MATFKVLLTFVTLACATHILEENRNRLGQVSIDSSNQHDFQSLVESQTTDFDLNIEGTDFRSLPQFLKKNSKIKSLRCSKNVELTDISAAFYISSLRKLCIEGSKLLKLETLVIPPNSQIEELTISYSGLSTVPNSFFRFPNLNTLDLSHNPIELLPKINNTNKILKKLVLSHTRIKSFDKSIQNLESLEVLALRHCRLFSAPSNLHKFSKLKELDLAENHFTALPALIEHLSCLKTLDLSCNYISLFPKWVLNRKNTLKIVACHNNIELFDFANHIGIATLKDNFANNFAYDKPVHSVRLVDLSLSTFFTEYVKQNLHWNINNLKFVKFIDFESEKLDADLVDQYQFFIDPKNKNIKLSAFIESIIRTTDDKNSGIPLEVQEMLNSLLILPVYLMYSSNPEFRDYFIKHFKKVSKSVTQVHIENASDLSIVRKLLFGKIDRSVLNKALIYYSIYRTMDLCIDAVVKELSIEPRYIFPIKLNSIMSLSLEFKLSENSDYLAPCETFVIGNALERFFKIFTPERVYDDNQEFFSLVYKAAFDEAIDTKNHPSFSLENITSCLVSEGLLIKSSTTEAEKRELAGIQQAFCSNLKLDAARENSAFNGFIKKITGGIFQTFRGQPQLS